MTTPGGDAIVTGSAVQRNPVLKFAQDVFAGTCGGVAVTLTGHPFDTLKVRLQSQSSSNPIYSGVVDCARKTIQWEGVTGLYKGVAAPLAGQMFFRATLFSALGSSKRWLSTDSDGNRRQLTMLDCYKAGAMAGGAAAFFEGPIDFYKSQVQVQIIRSKADPSYKPPFTSMPGCIKQSFAANGFRAPFQGLGPTLLRNIPANSIYLGSFEVMKIEAAKAYKCSVPELPAWVVLSAASLGGAMYWCAIYPVDVIKSAMMTDALASAERQYPNIVVTARKLWAEGGLPRFYKGFTPCLIRAAPANAAMLYTVDTVNNLLGNN
eukprot:jgi/Ulvmu1/11858/UM081_0016.1